MKKNHITATEIFLAVKSLK